MTSRDDQPADGKSRDRYYVVSGRQVRNPVHYVEAAHETQAREALAHEYRTLGWEMGITTCMPCRKAPESVQPLQSSAKEG